MAYWLEGTGLSFRHRFALTFWRGSTGYHQVSRESLSISVVAKSGLTAGRSDTQLCGMFQTPSSGSRTLDPFNIPNSTLATSSHQSFRVERVQVPTNCGLLLTLHRDSTTVQRIFNRSDSSHQVNFCQAWDSTNSYVRQWAAVLFNKVLQVCSRIWLLPGHEQPKVSTK